MYSDHCSSLWHTCTHAEPPPTTTCSTLHSIIDILENDVYVGQILEKGTCSVNDCHQIHCGLKGGRDLYIDIEDCNDPPGMSLYITNQDNTTAFNKTFTDGHKEVEFEGVIIVVRITQGSNTLEIEVCDLYCYWVVDWCLVVTSDIY